MITRISNRDLMKEWIQALRSGEYHQAREVLHSRDNDIDSYCCLGVLCELSVKHNMLRKDGCSYTYEFEDRYDGLGYQELETELEMFGLDVGLGSDEERLIQMNDGNKNKGIRQHNFNEIADYIEQNILPKVS